MANTLFAPSRGDQRTEMGRIIRFLTVGASGTTLDLVLFAALKQVFGWATLPANVVSFSAGILNNFTWNRLWTFADARTKRAYVQFLQFTVVSLGGLILNTLLVVLLEPRSGVAIAKILATGVVVCWNFCANRYWTFNDARQG